MFPRDKISKTLTVMNYPVFEHYDAVSWGALWLSGRVLDSRPKGHGFEPLWCPCVVSVSKNINPSLVLDQPRKTHPFILERLLMGRKESNQTKQNTLSFAFLVCIILYTDGK